MAATPVTSTSATTPSVAIRPLSLDPPRPALPVSAGPGVPAGVAAGVGVAVGVSWAAPSAETLTTPTIAWSACSRQMYSYEPGCVNVTSYDWPAGQLRPITPECTKPEPAKAVFGPEGERNVSSASGSIMSAGNGGGPAGKVTVCGVATVDSHTTVSPTPMFRLAG